MNEIYTILMIGCIVFATFTVEGISGFGSIVLALPFVVMLLGLDKAVPLLCCMSVFWGILILIRSWRNINWREYGFILCHAGLGLPAGLLMMDYLPRYLLLSVLTCFMIFVGCSTAVR